jgi:hypothetical protein
MSMPYQFRDKYFSVDAIILWIHKAFAGIPSPLIHINIPCHPQSFRETLYQSFFRHR